MMVTKLSRKRRSPNDRLSELNWEPDDAYTLTPLDISRGWFEHQLIHPRINYKLLVRCKVNAGEYAHTDMIVDETTGIVHVTLGGWETVDEYVRFQYYYRHGGRLVPKPDPVKFFHKMTSYSSDTLDYGEGGMCVLSSDLIIVAALSAGSYGVHLWACKPDPFEQGVDTIWYSYGNLSYYGIPDDPAVSDYAVVNDFSNLVPLSGTTFAIFTSPYRTMPDGKYLCVTFFEVDPTTLVISRTGFSTVDYTTYSPDEQTGAVWNGKVVLISDNNSSLGIFGPDGSVQEYDLSGILAATNPPSSQAISAVAVTGDAAVFLTFPPYPGGDNMEWWAIDLNTGTEIAHGLLTDTGNDNWSFHSTTLPDGRVAFITNGKDSLGDPCCVTVLDISDGTYNQKVLDDSFGLEVGWTGGWYSNVRDINTTPDGNLLVSWDDGTPRWAELDSNSLTELSRGSRSELQHSYTPNFYQTAKLSNGLTVGAWCGTPFVNGFGVFVFGGSA